MASLITAARVLGDSVLRAEVSLYASGTIAVRIQVKTSADALALGDDLGCGPLKHCTNDGRGWWVAERGEIGTDDLTITVTGGHRDTCICGSRG